MTDTTSAPASPPADPGPPPPAPPGLPTGSDRFFSWVRGFGIVRADGWLGGVCGGVAARLRIDPIIVRGIFVVVALIGFPALLIYAIAWALLPDASGRIHLRELFHARFDPAMIGILILAVVSLVPLAPWLWNATFTPLWGGFGGYPLPIWDLSSPSGGFGVILTLALIGGATFLIVRSARAGRRASAETSRTASAESDPMPATASSSGDDAAAAPLAEHGGSAGRAPAEPPSEAPGLLAPPPGPLADDAEIAQWRATHEAWRAQNDAWRRSQQDAERAAREQARHEREAAGAAFAAEAEERRRLRRATRPRTSFVFVLTALGAAVVTGAICALMAMTDAATAPFAAAIGLLAGAVVAALAMIGAGAFRRRSGFLAAVTIALLVAGLATAVASGPRSLALGHVHLATNASPVSITQPFGTADIVVLSLSDDETVTAGDISIHKVSGDTYITVYPGTVLDLKATLDRGGVNFSRIDQATGESEDGAVYPHDGPDGRAEWTWFVRNTGPSAEPATRQRIELDQAAGSVFVTIYESEENR
ncbi:PspC domain-containing protein [Microbacterium sp. HD4P20]|uniref:PspC domain-containing protein n=1 Tax=Microbacterium sp. HD4P20 TaxID=2864874 RepID=UPI001C63D8AD|nr:PspC domain-containing protein [Microbacterium sp. HD4P20]MCP2635220.1 PspC domain-containing protein [Microbacterium sp. HD4P20]